MMPSQSRMNYRALAQTIENHTDECEDGHVPISTVYPEIESFFPKLTEEDKEQKTDSGTPRWELQVRGMYAKLVRGGYAVAAADRPRGYYKLTEKGRRWAQADDMSDFVPTYTDPSKYGTKKGKHFPRPRVRAPMINNETENATEEDEIEEEEEELKEEELEKEEPESKSHPKQLFDTAAAEYEAYTRHRILSEIMRIDGFAFEEFTALLLERLGYGSRKNETLEITPPTCDGGVDIICYPFGQPKMAVQTRNKMAKVDVKEVRELDSASNSVGAEQGVIIAPGGFTGKAIALAKTLRVRTIDGKALVDMCIKAGLGVTSQDITVLRFNPETFKEFARKTTKRSEKT